MLPLFGSDTGSPSAPIGTPRGPLQLSLFDERDMAEIASPDYPGERLVVCKNPDLAAEPRQKAEGAS